MSVRDIVHMTCKELVELVTEYQCDALEGEARVTFEQHLFGCTWCMTYLKQVDRSIELTAQLRQSPSVGAPVVDKQQLAGLFRAWRKRE